MAALISYGIGYTPDSAAAGSLVIQPPPVYAAGNLLVMGVIAGGPSGGVAPALPSGWTRRSTSRSATLALFTKTATSSESAYTVSLASTGVAAGFVAGLTRRRRSSAAVVREQRRQHRVLHGDVPVRGHVRGDGAAARGLGRERG